MCWSPIFDMLLGCRAGFEDLLVELLVFIFSFLRTPLLRPPRLVCCCFRQASIQYITGLTLAGVSSISISNATSTFPGMTSTFPGMTSMTLLDGIPPTPEHWPLCVSKLRSLLVYNPVSDVASRLSAFVPLLSNLTSLRLLHMCTLRRVPSPPAIWNTF